MGTSRARQGAAQTEGDFSGSFSRTVGVRGASGEGAEKNGEALFPVDTTQYRVSDGYGWRQDPFTGERTFHKGIDLACAEGTDVIAAEGGAVVQAYCSTSYGTCLRVLHTDGSESLYAHLQYAYVRPGEVVETGQLLGAAGRSGRATGAHLHFELYRKGTACDPADALGLSS